MTLAGHMTISEGKLIPEVVDYAVVGVDEIAGIDLYLADPLDEGYVYVYDESRGNWVWRLKPAATPSDLRLAVARLRLRMQIRASRDRGRCARRMLARLESRKQ